MHAISDTVLTFRLTTMADMVSSALYFFSIILLIVQVSTMAVHPPSAGTCPPGSLMCLDGSQCYSASLRCDGHADCDDTTDEYACEGVEHSGEKNTTCPENSIPCKTGDQCIEKHQRCDKIEDCPDGSDEYNCPVVCEGEHLFLCGNGNCVSSDLKCNGEDNCGDYSDEVGCGAPVDESTASSETEDSTTDVKSLGTQDGSNDIQVAPEVGANKTKELYNCKEHEFHCHDGSCIDWSLLCDSEVHCPDGSDEGEGCFFQKDCGDSLRCGSGSCLPMEWVCDGNFDCPDKSDEKGCKKTLEPEETHENHGILKRLKKDVGVARLLEIQMETAQQEQTNQQHLYQLKVEELSTRNEAAQVELKAAQIWRDVMLERLEQQRKEHSLSLASFQGGKLEQGLNHTATEVPPQSTPAEAV